VLGTLFLALIIRGSPLRLQVDLHNSAPTGPIVARLETGWPMPMPVPVSVPAATPTEGMPTLNLSAHEELAPPPEPEPPFTGEQFDLGPSYEEEQQAKAEALRQQELAVLQEVFEQNLRLHEEVAQLAAEEEPHKDLDGQDGEE
jgi:hypothetical protein